MSSTSTRAEEPEERRGKSLGLLILLVSQEKTTEGRRNIGKVYIHIESNLVMKWGKQILSKGLSTMSEHLWDPLGRATLRFRF